MVRTIQEDDTEEFLHLYQAVDSETENMLYEEGERNYTVEEQADMIMMTSLCQNCFKNERRQSAFYKYKMKQAYNHS